MACLLQMDFPYAGPFGEEMTEAMSGLAHDIAGEDGLIWKIWTETRAEQRAGGIYMFADEARARVYRDKHTARLAQFGIHDVRAVLFDVNESLSRLDRAPL